MNLTKEKLEETIDVLVKINGINGEKGKSEDGVDFSDFTIESMQERAKEQAPIREKFEKFTYEELTEIFVLMMLGRGDVETEDFQKEYDLQVKCFDEGRGGYLMAKAPLAKYLIDGARKLEFLNY